MVSTVLAQGGRPRGVHASWLASSAPQLRRRRAPAARRLCWMRGRANPLHRRGSAGRPARRSSSSAAELAPTAGVGGHPHTISLASAPISRTPRARSRRDIISACGGAPPEDGGTRTSARAASPSRSTSHHLYKPSGDPTVEATPESPRGARHGARTPAPLFMKATTPTVQSRRLVAAARRVVERAAPQTGHQIRSGEARRRQRRGGQRPQRERRNSADVTRHRMAEQARREMSPDHAAGAAQDPQRLAGDDARAPPATQLRSARVDGLKDNAK